MTREEAIKAMSEGKKVTHDRFDENEWMTFVEGTNIIEFEDGSRCTSSEFWHLRPDWFNNFSLFKEE